MTTTDRQHDGLQASRRTIVRGAAWSVPVVAAATAAPAYAASPCDAITRTMDWGNTTQYSRASATNASYVVPDPDGSGPGQALTLTISNTFLGSNTMLRFQTSTATDNLRTVANVGGSSATSLTLHQSPRRDADKVATWTGTTNKSVWRFEFSRTVASLSFTLRDIDSSPADFLDAVAVVGGGATGAIVNTSRVTGTGSLSSPWRSSGTNLPAGDTSTAGNVNVSLSNVDFFELHYWNISDTSDSQIDGDQKVFLSAFNVNYKPC